MTIDEMIAVLTAAKEGKQIQVKDKESPQSGWRDEITLFWNFARFDFRVKPAPREFWINVPNHPTLPMWVSGDRFADSKHVSESIHVREVID